MSEPIDPDAVLVRFRDALAGAGDDKALYELQVRFLGKKGEVTALSRSLGTLPPADRKAFGERLNALKRQVELDLEGRAKALADARRTAELAEIDDLTFVRPRPSLGTLHPITRTRRELERVFTGLGFDVLDGPHVEVEAYNFDDLNIGPDHPARDMADTFFVKSPHAGADRLVLRTHTSPVQVRTMLEREPPIRIVAIGTVFRRDDDATHTPVFHQIEGLCVDHEVSMADLRLTLYRFVGAFFGRDLQVRLRPSFFPFVEPGAEFDVQCPFCAGKGCSTCKKSGWIELGGSGMVHPNVFRACGLDPERWTGWAFGFGIDRMAMLDHGIDDLRLMFEGDVRFLEQFPC
ncbi:MAG TPA: phenylalanine--tRNA ligase subunit alpha [Nannocystaceae bacterium]|nr:phenylalanine--tRNA ligase subunit alpha [Nannocystaceae bacterium]